MSTTQLAQSNTSESSESSESIFYEWITPTDTDSNPFQESLQSDDYIFIIKMYNDIVNRLTKRDWTQDQIDKISQDD